MGLLTGRTYHFAKLTVVKNVEHIYLKPEANGENEGANARDESRQERVEGERADEAAVDELHDSRDEDVGEVAVDDLEPLWSVVDVLVEELGHDGADCRGRGGRGRGG